MGYINTDFARSLRIVLTGAGLETPLATLHELRTVYTLEDFFYFLRVMKNHSEEVKEELNRLN